MVCRCSFAPSTILEMRSSLTELQSLVESVEKNPSSFSSLNSRVDAVCQRILNHVNLIEKENNCEILKLDHHMVIVSMDYLTQKDAFYIHGLRGVVANVARYCFHKEYQSLTQALEKNNFQTASAVVKNSGINPVFAKIKHGVGYECIWDNACDDGVQKLKWLISQKIDLNFSIQLRPNEYVFATTHIICANYQTVTAAQKIEMLRQLLQGGAKLNSETEGCCAVTEFFRRAQDIPGDKIIVITQLMLEAVREGQIGSHRCYPNSSPTNIISCIDNLCLIPPHDGARERNLLIAYASVAIMHGVNYPPHMESHRVRRKEAGAAEKEGYSFPSIAKMRDSIRERIMIRQVQTAAITKHILDQYQVLPECTNLILQYAQYTDRGLRINVARECFLRVYNFKCWEEVKASNDSNKLNS